MQLLYYQAPLSAVAVAIMVPIFEPISGVGGVFGPWSYDALVLLFYCHLIRIIFVSTLI